MCFFLTCFRLQDLQAHFPLCFLCSEIILAKLCLVAEVEATFFPWRDFVDGPSEGMAEWHRGQGTPSGEENLRDVFETLLQEE